MPKLLQRKAVSWLARRGNGPPPRIDLQFFATAPTIATIPSNNLGHRYRFPPVRRYRTPRIPIAPFSGHKIKEEPAMNAQPNTTISLLPPFTRETAILKIRAVEDPSFSTVATRSLPSLPASGMKNSTTASSRNSGRSTATELPFASPTNRMTKPGNGTAPTAMRTGSSTPPGSQDSAMPASTISPSKSRIDCFAGPWVAVQTNTQA